LGYLFAMREIGKLLVLFGGLIMIIGLALWSGFAPAWLGRLPGDIRIERGNSAFYFPIVTCLIISIVLSLILSFFRR
jgi:hypothetical protein